MKILVSSTLFLLGKTLTKPSCFNMIENNINDMNEITKAEIQKLRPHFPELEVSGVDDFIHSSVNNSQDHTFIISNPYVARKYLKSFDVVLFDCDGVLYRGTEPTPHAGELISWLMTQNKEVLFVTNNAAKSRMELRDKLSELLSCPKLSESQMVGSAYSCSRFLQNSFSNDRTDISNEKRKVYVVGSQGLCREIQNAGFQVITSSLEDKPGMSAEEVSAIQDCDYGSVDAVVIGLDTDFTYRTMCIATYHLRRNPKSLFIATNKDSFDLVGTGRFQPGNGCLVSAIELASERKAINVGKPSTFLTDLIREEHGFKNKQGKFSKALMIGDRIDTDINFGKVGGMATCSVLTGCTNAESLLSLMSRLNNSTNNKNDKDTLPNIIMPYIGLALEDI